MLHRKKRPCYLYIELLSLKLSIEEASSWTVGNMNMDLALFPLNYLACRMFLDSTGQAAS
jgi:hypothetical protein